MRDGDRQSGETEAQRVRNRPKKTQGQSQRQTDKKRQTGRQRNRDRARRRGVGVTQLTFQPQHRSLYNPHSLLVVSLPADWMPAPLYR